MNKDNTQNKFFLRTFGCQMNTRDSEFVTGLFLERGYALADSPESADVILFNTCSVRAHAEERAVSNMGQLLRNQDRKPETINRKPIYGIIGCMAQAKKEELFRRLPGLDIICGTGEIHKLIDYVEMAKREKVLAVKDIDSHLPQLKSDYREDKKHAYVSIMRGCDNFCSYCIVPYVRGRERSRSVKDIVREIEMLARNGTRNITLLGQNVNSYRHETYDFIGLLKCIHEIEGIAEIGFITSHPKDASSRLFRVMRDLPKIRKHLHLPLQSGSDKILKLMNRRYTGKKYLALALDARRTIPGLRLTTDIIVGFPGETETDFNCTLDLMKKVRFDAAYIFKYSPRPATKARLLEDDVPYNTKKTRHKLLLDMQRKLLKRKICV